MFLRKWARDCVPSTQVELPAGELGATVVASAEAEGGLAQALIVKDPVVEYEVVVLVVVDV